MGNVISGEKESTKGLTATQSLKQELKSLIPSLPTDWRLQMKEADNFYRTDKGNARLDNIRGGYAAPTLDELVLLRKIANL